MGPDPPDFQNLPSSRTLLLLPSDRLSEVPSQRERAQVEGGVEEVGVASSTMYLYGEDYRLVAA